MPTSQAALRGSEWDTVTVAYGHGPSPVTYVYRREGSTGWEPWLVVAESAIMERLGRRGNGLYAARAFANGSYLGRYSGELIGHYGTRQEALEAPETRRLAQRGRDKLVVIRSAQGRGFDLIDGDRAGPPHLEMANDPRGTRLGANVNLTDAGWMRVESSRGVPPFDLSRSLQDNIRSELRWEYGEDYWALHEQLGNNAANAIDLVD
jgi:hypothetical protein